jgi:hypothetical protein
VKRRRHTPEQIIRKLREAERMLGEGKRDPAPDGRYPATLRAGRPSDLRRRALTTTPRRRPAAFSSATSQTSSTAAWSVTWPHAPPSPSSLHNRARPRAVKGGPTEPSASEPRKQHPLTAIGVAARDHSHEEGLDIEAFARRGRRWATPASATRSRALPSAAAKALALVGA